MFGEVNIAAERGWLNREIEPAAKKISEGEQIMARHLAAARYQQGVAPERLYGRIERVESREIRIVKPQLREPGADVGDEPARVSPVQVPDRRRQHHDVPESKMRLQHELAGCCTAHDSAKSGG